MSEGLRVLIEAPRPGERVDACACRAFGLPSRTAARRALKRGEVLLNGAAVETSRFVRPGDELVLLRRPPAVTPWRRDLEVVFQDEHLAVVDKPPGHPVRASTFRTVENALPYALPRSSAGDALERPRAVHRLDVRTRGLLVVAKTASALVALGRAFEERRVAKRYRAFVRGALEGGGTVRTLIEGREALTRWRTAAVHPSLHGGAFSELLLEPKTGRTHQVRLHCAGLGHPVLGDDLHTSEGLVLRGSGLFLQACGLELDHPRGGRLRFELPEPDKWRRFRERELRRVAASTLPGASR